VSEAPSPPAGDSAPAPRAPGGFRTFLVLWSTQTLSLFGTFVSLFAVNIWLTVELYPRPEQRPALALGLSATTIATILPLLVVMPLAGAFADRHDRRHIMLVANVCSALLTGLLFALLLAHVLTLWVAVALLTGYAVSGSFHSAAFDSSYGLLVPESQLGRANGMMQTSFALSQVLAPAIAAALIGAPALARSTRVPLPWLASLPSGVPFAFAADALTFVIAAVAIALLRIPSPARRVARNASVWTDVREGIEWIVRRRPFLWLMSFGFLANFTFAPLMLLLPLLVRDRLAADRVHHHMAFEAALAIVNMAMGAGGVVGGVAMSLWGGLRRNRVLGMIGAMTLLGVGEAVAGVSTSVTMLAVGLFLSELLVPALNAHSFMLWQSLTPPEILARALSTRRFLSQIAFPIGTALAGWLAATHDPWIIVVVAGLTLTVVCTLQFARPSFFTLEDRIRESAGTRLPAR